MISDLSLQQTQVTCLQRFYINVILLGILQRVLKIKRTSFPILQQCRKGSEWDQNEATQSMKMLMGAIGGTGGTTSMGGMKGNGGKTSMRGIRGIGGTIGMGGIKEMRGIGDTTEMGGIEGMQGIGGTMDIVGTEGMRGRGI